MRVLLQMYEGYLGGLLIVGIIAGLYLIHRSLPWT